jgi:tetratricopeptide (TPR) repeat protein
MELAKKAVSIDDSLGLPHSVLGFIYIMYKRDFEKGIAEAERAVALEPNSSEAYTQLAVHLLWAGRPEEAIALFKKAIRLSPIPPFRSLLRMADAYANIGQYEEAVAIYKKIIQAQPHQVFAHIHLAVTLMLAGKEDEARAEATEVLRLDPEFSLERFAKSRPLKNQLEIDREVTALRKAGLK